MTSLTRYLVCQAALVKRKSFALVSSTVLAAASLAMPISALSSDEAQMVHQVFACTDV